VGRKISDGGDRGTPGYQREWQGILQAKKARYPLDMEGFWLSDKFRIRAVINPFTFNSILKGN